jgi:hypothetical protein
MSNNQNNQTAPAATGLLGKIMKILKLDEAGKIGTFLEKEVKICNNEIKALGHNKSALEFNFNSKKDTLNDKIEDAKEAVEAAYTSIKLSDIENNEAQASFREKFWQNIKRRENTLASLEEELKDLTKAFEEDIKENKEQVDKYKARIAKLS